MTLPTVHIVSQTFVLLQLLRTDSKRGNQKPERPAVQSDGCSAVAGQSLFANRTCVTPLNPALLSRANLHGVAVIGLAAFCQE